MWFFKETIMLSFLIDHRHTIYMTLDDAHVFNDCYHINTTLYRYNYLIGISIVVQMFFLFPHNLHFRQQMACRGSTLTLHKYATDQNPSFLLHFFLPPYACHDIKNLDIAVIEPRSSYTRSNSLSISPLQASRAITRATLFQV